MPVCGTYVVRWPLRTLWTNERSASRCYVKGRLKTAAPEPTFVVMPVGDVVTKAGHGPAAVINGGSLCSAKDISR